MASFRGHRRDVPVDLLEQVGVLLHRLGELGVLTQQGLDVVCVALGVHGDLGGDGVGSFGGDQQSRGLNTGEHGQDEVEQAVGVRAERRDACASVSASQWWPWPNHHPTRCRDWGFATRPIFMLRCRHPRGYAGAMLLHAYLDRVGAAGVFATLTGGPARRYDDLAVLTTATLAFALGVDTVEGTKHLRRAGPPVS